MYTKFQEGLLITMKNSIHEVSRAAVLRNLDVSVPTKQLLNGVMISLERVSQMDGHFPTSSLDGKTLLIP